MTIEAKTTFTPPKRKTVLAATTEEGVEIKARQNAKEVRIDLPNAAYMGSAYINYEHIDAVIELLFAVKADREAQAAFEKKWLADQSALADTPRRLIEDDPLDIIAVDEPTA